MTATVELCDVPTIAQRIDRFDWLQAEQDLNARGCTVLKGMLSPEECATLVRLYDDGNIFRRRITMQDHNFGRGEYQYFDYPLPDAVSELRTALYPRLAPVANAWAQASGTAARYPMALADFLASCHAAGQCRPTPLLLRYGRDDYNCLHQDIYGEHVFPLQATVLLSSPGRDFTGGEFVLTEQRPRMQSRVEVIDLEQGDMVVFAVRHRPVAGSRSTYRVNMRHGVSRVRSGQRFTMGIIFHDAA